MAKILIVDDSDMLREKLAEILSQAGHEVLVGADGKQGIALAKAHPEVELVIADFNMPEMDGLAMLRGIQELPGVSPKATFMLTTETSPALKELGSQCGVRAWIVKPFVPSSLLAVIKKVLSG